MADSNLPLFVKGQVSIGSGQLQFSTTAKFSATNGAKLKHSMRRSPSGVVMGHNEITGSIELDVSADGPERDWWLMLSKGQLKQALFEAPKDDVALNIVVTGIDRDHPSDDAIHQTVNFIASLAT